MSYIDFKEVTINNPGSSIRYGGDDLKQIMQILNGRIVAQKRPKILNEWIWLDHFDIQPPVTAPVAPTNTNTSRIYVDPTDFKVKVKKTNNAILDIENINIPETALAGTLSKNKIPAATAYEDEANTFTQIQAINKASEVGIAETLATFKVADDASSVLEILNVSTVAGEFVPFIRSSNHLATAAHPGLYLFSRILSTQDSGTTPVLIFDARTTVNGAISTRPLFRFRNAAVPVFEITNTQIDHTNKTLVNPGNIVINNASNTFGLFDQIFKSSRLVVRNPADTFSYIFAGGAIIANRTVTLPLLTADDVLVTEAFVQSLSNKTISPYIDFDDTTTPTNPASGFRRLFANSANSSRLSLLKSDGTLLDLEAAAQISNLDSLTDVTITLPILSQVLTWNGTAWVNAIPPGQGGGEANTASNIGTAGVGFHKQKTGVNLEFYKLNALSSKLSIALDGTNNKVDIDVTEANLTLNNIGGAISTRSKLPTQVVYDDEANTYGDFDQIFRSSRLKITNPANTFNYTIVSSAITAARNLTIPLITTDDIFVLAGFEMDITARKKFTDASFSLYNPAATFQYIIRTSTITADRNVALPLLTVDDTLVTESFTQSLTSKTMDGNFNTFLNVPDSAISATGITTRSKLPSTLAYEDEINNFTSAQTFNSYLDYTKIAAPANPAAEAARQYFKEINANNNTIAIKQEINGAIREVRAF